MKVLKHPKRGKICALCEFWIGDAGLEYSGPVNGYKVDTAAKGKCTKNRGAQRLAGEGNLCTYYEPSREAKKLL